MGLKASSRLAASRWPGRRPVHPHASSLITAKASSARAMGSASPRWWGKIGLDWFESELKKKYELTVGPGLGPGDGDTKEATVLNRVVRWTEEGLEYEADPRQAEGLIHGCGMGGSNSVSTPGLKETAAQVAEDTPLEHRLHTPYRSSAARPNYLAADCVDVQFAPKAVCRWMSAPTCSGWTGFKGLTRFLCGMPRLVYLYPWQEIEAIDVYVDADRQNAPAPARARREDV